MQGSKLLNRFIQGIRILTGAGCVSLYIPGIKTRPARPALLHDGDQEPVPELKDDESAKNFLQMLDPNALQLETDGYPVCIPSSIADGELIALPSDEMSWLLPDSASPQASRRRSDSGEKSKAAAAGAWLGLRFPPGQGLAPDRLAQIDFLSRLDQSTDIGSWWSWLFALGGALASHTVQATALLKDPLTGLADRREFQAVLSQELERAQSESRPLSLLMINPDDFFAVNEQIGRDEGDRCVREISDRLRMTLRSEDLVSRYGGVIFAAILPDTPPGDAHEIADRLWHSLADEPYLDGALQLAFSIGCSGETGTEEGASQILGASKGGGEGASRLLELVQRADRALSAAKRSGGNQVRVWDDRAGDEDSGSIDRLSGIFTGNLNTDYRNMVLLWDTVNVIALDPDFDELVTQVVERLYEAFKPVRVGLFSRSFDDEFNLLHGFTRSTGAGNQTTRLETLDLSAEQRALMKATITEGTALAHQLTDSDQELRCCAVPLIAGNDCLGCLYLDGRADALSLDASDLIFFRALGSQVATAMDRTRLAEIETRRQEQEKRMLRAELKELRQALQQAKLVFRSPQMESLVATAHRVALTDATILITGASGTGKELLARTVHELSTRQGQPFVIVDCGAIPTTLIESELFGSEKGAYTGAQARRAGRLAEANYGTVLLDEIGELPLEVQSKMLRFVQEKQLTRVGGTRQQKVDVRILAATNRDLKEEVATGRFREDLYYRLNVIHLAVPPLSERPDDILHLANHFLEIFSVQYQKNVRRLTSAAASALSRHNWPGNVRELQNRIMQAVILTEGSQLGPEDLGLTSTSPSSTVAGSAGVPADSESVPLRETPIAEDVAQASPGASISTPSRSNLEVAEETPQDLDSLLLDLREKLAELVYAAQNGLSPTMLPLGRWLDEDLLVAADTLAHGVARRAASILGLPETTFRRRLRKAKDQIYAGLSPRIADWEDVRPTLSQLVGSTGESGLDLITFTQQILLEEIAARFPDNVRAGAALLAVSNPTYRKRLAELEASQSEAPQVAASSATANWSSTAPSADFDPDFYPHG
jgi:diguanylate cyclase (GGDEF)-like protein